MSKKNEEIKEEVENENSETNSEETTENNKVEELEQRLEQALRAYASCENDKKIMEKQKTQAIDYAVEKFVKDLYQLLIHLNLL